jgi:hypothetical protein
VTSWAHDHALLAGLDDGRERRRVREPAGEVEFATVMVFDDLDAARVFAGEDHEASYVPDAARAVLARFDERAAHYEVLRTPEQTLRA